MMTRRFFTLLFLLSALWSTMQADDWMASLSDEAYLSQLCIPGTHDSCTGEGWQGLAVLVGESMGKTQELTIARQLEAGVRCFDLRPCVNGQSLVINHGMLQTKATFVNVVRQLGQFVADHPTEFVIVIMRHETDGDSNNSGWGGLISAALNSSDIRPTLADYRRDITVGELRGKVLILSRDSYGDTPRGAYIEGWGHAADYVTAAVRGQGNAGVCYIQDFYEVMDNMAEKQRGIRKLLDFSMANVYRRGTRHLILCINHTSGYTKSASTDGNRDNAAKANKDLLDYLANASRKGPTGIVVTDFAGVDRSGSYDVMGKQVVDAVIAMNSQYEPVKRETNAIEAPDGPSAAPAAIYDLQGRLCVSASQPGVYIVDGKKRMK